jgi:hypothetical protein
MFFGELFSPKWRAISTVNPFFFYPILLTSFPTRPVYLTVPGTSFLTAIWLPAASRQAIGMLSFSGNAL